MTPVRVMLGALLATGLVAGIVGLSQVPYVASPGEDGELRLAWRWRSERVERCRRLAPEELAKLPAHMRNPVSCQRALRTYQLEVWADEARVLLDTVRARGAESDRPLSVLRRITLPTGRHEVHVVFSPQAMPGDSAAALAAPLELEARIVVAPRQVVLVTLDDAQHRLVLRTSAGGRIEDRR